VWIAFANKFEKGYREMTYSKVFPVRATLVILLLFKKACIDSVLSSFKDGSSEVDKCRFEL
jgi:hypothetical protein